VLFLSPSVATSLIPNQDIHSGKLAFNKDKCIKMGDHCFHPQYGIVTEGKETKESPGVKSKNIDYKAVSFEQVDELKCSGGDFFDFYCGKVKEHEKAKNNFEVWIDTSASMKRVDVEEQSGYCERRHFVSNLQSSCKRRAEISAFNTSKKEILNEAYLCSHRGPNDQKRLVRWAKASTAKHLVIVTDVDEYNGEFREFLDGVGAIIEGIGVQPLYSKDMNTLIAKLSKSCSKS
jgi:hypothetical protein